MGMSTHIVISKDETEKHKQMRDVYRACDKAGINAPEDVLKYFDYLEIEEVENMTGAEPESVDIDKLRTQSGDGTDSYRVDMEVMVNAGWKYIEFSNCW